MEMWSIMEAVQEPTVVSMVVQSTQILMAMSPIAEVARAPVVDISKDVIESMIHLETTGLVTAIFQEPLEKVVTTTVMTAMEVAGHPINRDD